MFRNLNKALLALHVSVFFVFAAEFFIGTQFIVYNITAKKSSISLKSYFPDPCLLRLFCLFWSILLHSVILWTRKRLTHQIPSIVRLPQLDRSNAAPNCIRILFCKIEYISRVHRPLRMSDSAHQSNSIRVVRVAVEKRAIRHGRWCIEALQEVIERWIRSVPPKEPSGKRSGEEIR